MIKLNREKLKDKIYACWIGKNIGGTIGAPYEGKTDFLNVEGFSTEKGAPLPNDDLDLQLVFLGALEEQGPRNVNSGTFAEYWINYIIPNWNEYSVGKSNMRAGILPPMSGEVFNDKWKNSNGAWIRSELWACLTPGYPEVAAPFVFMDASVDHGMSEGTYAEVFTFYMESCAFFEKDIRKIIETALGKIPENCRTARSVRLAVECYDSGMCLKEARDAIVEENKDLGWFQAPGNIGFVILGLLYGEGDFKKSVLSAVNCGDDTDCTAATVGAFLGILYGMEGIPEDWKEHIGDGIVTISIDNTYEAPAKTCSELTERTLDMIPRMYHDFNFKMEWTDGEHQIERDFENNFHLANLIPPFENRTRYCYDYSCLPYIHTIIAFDDNYIIKPDGEIKVSVTFRNSGPDCRNGRIKLYLPEGFECDDYQRNIQIPIQRFGVVKWTAVIKAGVAVSSMNRAILEVDFAGKPIPALIPINILG